MFVIIENVKKTTLRKYSLFSLNPKYPASVICWIIYQFFIPKTNATPELIKNKFKNHSSLKTIYDILFKIQKIIADYLKYIYRAKQIGGPPEKKHYCSSWWKFVVHDTNNQQIWIVGAKETLSNKFRLDIINTRNSDNLKIFVENHIEPGTKIVTDGLAGYTFLDDSENSVYEHEIHNHGAGDFGFGISSTSHIENLWANIKNQIKSIYNKIPNKNFIYFLWEAEFRLILSKKKNEDKLNYFKNCVKIVFQLHEFDFYPEEELIDFDNYGY